MDAKELRIGNLVLDRKNRICIVDEIRNDQLNLYFSASAIDGCCTSLPHKPIPLTKEWLLKFGFEWEKLDLASIKDYRKGLLSVSIGVKTRILSIYVGIQRIDNGDKIKHVHQLQNLYFALTGEELKVKK